MGWGKSHDVNCAMAMADWQSKDRRIHIVLSYRVLGAILNNVSGNRVAAKRLGH